jgi:hypothetical protein
VSALYNLFPGDDVKPATTPGDGGGGDVKSKFTTVAVSLDEAFEETLTLSCDNINETVFSADLRSDALVAIAVFASKITVGADASSSQIEAVEETKQRAAMLGKKLNRPVVLFTGENVGEGGPVRIVDIQDWIVGTA